MTASPLLVSRATDFAFCHLLRMQDGAVPLVRENVILVGVGPDPCTSNSRRNAVVNGPARGASKVPMGLNTAEAGRGSTVSIWWLGETLDTRCPPQTKRRTYLRVPGASS